MTLVSPSNRAFSLVAIGASTGGPAALTEVLKSLPQEFPVPIVVVQHTIAGLTRALARQFDACCPLTVTEATHGETLIPGKVYLAPSGKHMTLRPGDRRQPVADIRKGRTMHGVMPAVDVLMASLPRGLRDPAVCVILTGMGVDGRDGVQAAKAAGSRILIQNAASSVVWGMPGAVFKAGLADEVMHLAHISRRLCSLVEQERTR